MIFQRSLSISNGKRSIRKVDQRETLIVLTDSITPRLKYIADFLSQELEGKPAELSTDISAYQNHNGIRINYTQNRQTIAEIYFKPQGLLSKNVIEAQSIDVVVENGRSIFFKNESDTGFDFFSAAFYLISRYEEYLPHTKDIYGRYAHENSLAYKNGFLNLPLVNIWIKELKGLIRQKFPSITLKSSLFYFVPSYDIDIAWAYKNKGFWNNSFGLAKALITFDFKTFATRLKVLRGKEKDPFDSYSYLNQLHQKHNLKPYYFFLLAKKRKAFDKNISPANKELADLIRDHEIRYPIGIHPSWQSGDHTELLKEEIETLTKITGNPVKASRQHYIRFELPDGYRRLIANKIGFDFSMGYGSINGFRASVTTPYFWYDLPNETLSTLLIFPFCFMEANSFYEQKFTAGQALEEMRSYYKATKEVDGLMITIWHNNFLGSYSLYNGWKEIYEEFLQNPG